MNSLLKNAAAFLLALATVLVAQTITGVSIIGARLGAQAGSGDMVGPASSVSNWVMFFDGATGKLAKGNPTFSGVLRLNAGVGSVVTGTATDCVLVNGTSGPCGSGGGSITVGDGLQTISGVTSVDATVPSIVVAGTSTVTFGTISSGSCVSQTVTATGMPIGAIPTIGRPPTFPVDVELKATATAADQLTWTACKYTAGASGSLSGVTIGYQVITGR